MISEAVRYSKLHPVFCINAYALGGKYKAVWSSVRDKKKHNEINKHLQISS